MTRSGLTISIIFCAAIASGLAAFVQDSERDKVNAARAQCLRHFIEYTTWPADRFADENAPIVIAVLGDDEFMPILRYIAGRERIHGRSLEVREYAYPPTDSHFAQNVQSLMERLRNSHVLYIAQTERTRVRSVLESVRGRDVLTTSDLPRFCEQGGMLAIAIRQGRPAIDANVEEIQKTRLSVSSKLLRLARIVRTEP